MIRLRDTTGKFIQKYPVNVYKVYPREYRTWRSMVERCTKLDHHAYSDYGGRGITVDENWRTNFWSFLTDVGPKPSEDVSLDRIDNDKGYYKENIRWATQAIQCRNTRYNININYRGKTQCLMDWSRELRIPFATLAKRKRSGWSDLDVLTKPINLRKSRGRKLY